MESVTELKIWSKGMAKTLPAFTSAAERLSTRYRSLSDVYWASQRLRNEIVPYSS